MPPNPRVGGLDMEIDRPGAPSGDGLRWVKGYLIVLKLNSAFFNLRFVCLDKIFKTFHREAIKDAT
jgi:hypothetical protein